MPNCKHPNTRTCPGGDCVCYMEDRDDEQERRFQTIVKQKIHPPEGKGQDCVFESHVFRQFADFEGVIFSGEANFIAGTFREGASFKSARFQRGTSFFFATFQDRADFEDGTFHGTAGFEWVRFRGDARFFGVEFRGRAHFMNAMFYGAADFMAARFHSKAHFNNPLFCRSAKFTSVAFHDGANFEQATFRVAVDFRSAVSPGNMAVEAEAVHAPLGRAAQLYRLAKQSHQDCGDYIVAGEYHYLERLHAWYESVRLPDWCRQRWALAFDGYRVVRTREPGLPQLVTYQEWRGDSVRTLHPKRRRYWWGRIARLRVHAYLHALGLHVWAAVRHPGYVFGNLAFGYGERLLRPFAAGALVVLLWALAYSWTGVVEGTGGIALLTERKGTTFVESANTFTFELARCVYFSIVTFSTLGYGDMRPVPGLCSWLANAESLIGLVLVATFAVCLAKRFTRG